MQALSICYVAATVEHSGTLRNNIRSRTGRSGLDGGGPPYARAPESALGLPSPVDAFHRPQAPASPHVTTPHERALRVDGTGITNHSDRRTEKQVAVTAALAREAAGEERASAGFAGRAGRHGGFGRT